MTFLETPRRWGSRVVTGAVFHADQRGMRTFLIRTLGQELRGHPHPHGGPQRQQGQELVLERIS